MPPDVIFFAGLAGQVLEGDVVYIPGIDGGERMAHRSLREGNSGEPRRSGAGQLPIPLPEATTPVSAPIGSVDKIDVGVNYMSHAPRSLVNAIAGAPGTLDTTLGYRYLTGRTGSIRRLGRYHPATTGPWTAPTSTITVTFPDTSFPLKKLWKKGDRITTDVLDGSGNPIIPRGTYVLATATSPDRIQVSKTLVISGTNARLFDADVLRVVMVAE